MTDEALGGVFAMPWEDVVARVDEVAATGDRRARGVLRDMLKHERAGRRDEAEEFFCRLEAGVYVDGELAPSPNEGLNGRVAHGHDVVHEVTT